MNNTYLNLPIDDEDSLLQLQGASVSYRIALGHNKGKKYLPYNTSQCHCLCIGVLSIQKMVTAGAIRGSYLVGPLVFL
jgi:hypothetical protein